MLYTAVAGTDDYEIGGGSIALPAVAVARAGRTPLLDAVLTGGDQRASTASSSHKTVTTRGTLPAIEGRFKDPHGYTARILVVVSNSSLIVLVVHAKSGADRLYKALETSLIIR